MRRGISGVGGLVIAAIVAWSCTGVLPHDDCLDYGTCEGLAGEGGVDSEGGMNGDGGEGGVIVPPNCDLTKSAKDSPDCVADGVGVFASPGGDDTAPGTKLKPVRSIAKAVELAAAASKPRVYLCTGTYNDSVEIKNPISIFGGYTCNGADWMNTGAGVTWNATKPDFGLRITGAGSRVFVDDVEIDAKDGAAPGESSIGVFVADSAEVIFERVSISAGKGVNGVTKVKKTTAGNALSGGNAAAGAAGGAGMKNVCPDGDSTGGNGGTVGADDATPGQPQALGGGAKGMVATDCSAGGSGLSGGPGGAGANAPSSAGLGVLSATGWTPGNGTAGTSGNRAQGGGGGGSRTGAGGGGGAGGCGGSAGEGGSGGGASIAIVTLASKLSLVASKLTALGAGNGGDGAGGQVGQPPGGGGSGGTAAPFNGCPGGQGGSGGNGGAGGGGAGGISTPILYKGPLPVTTDTTLTKGTAGIKGHGGDGVGPDGPDGVAQDTLMVN